jgi:hypothetical protein
MIPKIIWQTYEGPFEELPQYIKDCVQTWKDNNPNWEYRYMDSQQRDLFVLEQFGEEWHKIFVNLPYGVLKADVWRHMVLYVFGGVYADIDTICKSPIEIWLKENMDTTYFLDDDSKNLCQFILSSSKNNIVFIKILELIKNKLTNKELIKSMFGERIQDFEENITGNIACTEAVREFLDIPANLNLLNDYDQINNLKSLKNNNFFYYGKESFDMLHNYPIKHLGASSIGNWTDGYIQWQKQEKITKEFL